MSLFGGRIEQNKISTRGEAGESTEASISGKNIKISPDYEKMIESINSEPSLSKVDDSIGQYYNYKYVANNDLKKLLSELNRIKPEFQKKVKEILDVYLNPNGRYWLGNIDTFNQWNEYDTNYANSYKAYRDGLIKQRQQGLTNLIGDAAYDRGQQMRQHKIKDGSATLEQYKLWAGHHNDLNSLEQIYLDVFFPKVGNNIKYDVVNDISYAGASKTIPKEIRIFLDNLLQTSYNLWTGGFDTQPISSTKQLLSLIKNDSGGSIENNPLNLLKMNTSKLNSIIQAGFSFLDDSSGKRAQYFLMQTMLDEGKSQGLLTQQFFEKHKDTPIEALKIAMPYLLAYDIAENAIDSFIDYVAQQVKAKTSKENPIFSFVIDETAGELKEQLKKQKEETDKSIDSQMNN
jgi:hypothetical protein